MKTFRTIAAASLFGLSTGLALAQPGTGPGAASGRMGAGPVASAAGMGKGMGPGAGHGMARWGSKYTPGWALMTEPERNEHRARMRAMQSYDECKAYQAQHHEQMAARAKERGGPALAAPRRDACQRLKP